MEDPESLTKPFFKMLTESVSYRKVFIGCLLSSRKFNKISVANQYVAKIRELYLLLKAVTNLVYNQTLFFVLYVTFR